MADASWYVYIAECADGTYYTGSTTDPVRREREHNSDDRGAKYTRSRRPVKIVFYQRMADMSSALKAECAIKKKSRKDKRNIIKNQKVC